MNKNTYRFQNDIIGPLNIISKAIFHLTANNKNQRVVEALSGAISAGCLVGTFRKKPNELEVRIPVGEDVDNNFRLMYIHIQVDENSHYVGLDYDVDGQVNTHISMLDVKDNGFMTFKGCCSGYETFKIDMEHLDEVSYSLRTIIKYLDMCLSKVHGDRLSKLKDAIDYYMTIKDLMNENPDIRWDGDFFSTLTNRLFRTKYSIWALETQFNIGLTIRRHDTTLDGYDEVSIDMLYNEYDNKFHTYLSGNTPQEVHRITDVRLANGDQNIVEFIFDDKYVVKSRLTDIEVKEINVQARGIRDIFPGALKKRENI